MLKDSGANTPESKLFIGQQIANGYSYQEIRVSHRYRNDNEDTADSSVFELHYVIIISLSTRNAISCSLIRL